MSHNISYQSVKINTADGLTMHVRQYDVPASNQDQAMPVLCLHGLTRTSADYAPLIEHLSTKGNYRFIVPDLRGRGDSSRDPNPENYDLPTYLDDCERILKHFSVDRFAILGSSLGGLIAMELHRLNPARIMGVAMNDIGPVLPESGLVGVLSFVGMQMYAENWAEAAQLTQARLKTEYPTINDEKWLEITKRSYQKQDDGSLALSYDPKISVSLKAAFKAGYKLDLWASFEGITEIPLLCLRGEHSKLLTAELLQEMLDRNANLQTALVTERGHVPLLDEKISVSAIQQWLKASDDHFQTIKK